MLPPPYARLHGLRAILSHISLSISLIYSETLNSLPHSMQRKYTVFQPIISLISPLHSLHFIVFLIYHTTMELLNLLNHELSWHKRSDWDEAIELLKTFSSEHTDELSHVKDLARIIKYRIDEIDSFIQQNTAAVCPHCEKACCINRHGYYDFEDLIYIHALGLEPPPYKECMDDTEPCQFLSQEGCTMRRSVRPFRCNWYFCNALLKHIEQGPAKPYRVFIKQLNEIVDLRKDMLDGFFRILKANSLYILSSPE